MCTYTGHCSTSGFSRHIPKGMRSGTECGYMGTLYCILSTPSKHLLIYSCNDEPTGRTESHTVDARVSVRLQNGIKVNFQKITQECLKALIHHGLIDCQWYFIRGNNMKEI